MTSPLPDSTPSGKAGHRTPCEKRQPAHSSLLVRADVLKNLAALLPAERLLVLLTYQGPVSALVEGKSERVLDVWNATRRDLAPGALHFEIRLRSRC